MSFLTFLFIFEKKKTYKEIQLQMNCRACDQKSSLEPKFQDFSELF